jgi:predicted kinase
MPQVILVVGCTGAGKTTYSRALADEMGGIRFSIDEWMMPLFSPDSPKPLQFAWMMERVNRCETMIFAMAKQVVARGCPAVLDLGFTREQHRDKFRSLCADAGLSVAVHFIDVPRETRWHRVSQRNVEQGETFAMTVDRGMFDFMETMWEPPTSEEWQSNGGLRRPWAADRCSVFPEK